MDIKFKRLSEKAVKPIRATKGSAGFDLTSTHVTTEVSECGQIILVYHTDLAIEIPEGYVALMFPRSSISKKSIRLCNSVGVIDSDYRGEVMGKFVVTTDVIPALYKEGERFAQLVIVPTFVEDFVETEELTETERKTGGFGSTNEVTDSQSAPTGSQSFPEDKNEFMNSETANDGSGEAQSGLEQAQ
jgi:dUTP pyrophosphatase